MTAAEQARLATVEEHVRGENARDMDVVMGTFGTSDHVGVLYNGIPTRGTPRFAARMRSDSTRCRTSGSR